MRLVLLVVLAACAAPAFGKSSLKAVRTPRPIEVDGKVDEAAWQAAPAFRDFVVSYPRQGARPSQETEVRILYDDDNLYVSFVCHDSEPTRIVATLDRRDNLPSTSDWVKVQIDSANDGRTAYAFAVNAAGVMQDALLFDDLNSTTSWDAVWNARVALLPFGWSAELMIPLSVLRFRERPEQSWGFDAQRNIPRTHEQIDSTLLPHAVNGYVSRFGTLSGLRRLQPKPGLELRPYVAARGTLRPRYDAPDRPKPRLFDPALDVGLDLKSAITSRLTLNLAVNPDFGEVEPDALVLNLGNTEVYYSELRTFFTQGLELFQPLSGGGNGGASGVTPFYSRRIGLSAPILGSAKLVGGLGEDLKLGVLEAVVLGAQDDAKAPYAFSGMDTDLAPLNRRVRWHPSIPFHLGYDDELPAQRAPSMNFFAAVARQKILHNSAVGLTFTSAAPLGALCDANDFFDRADYQPDACAARGGNGLSLESSLATDDGDWGVKTMLNGSQVVGGPSAFRRRDGVEMHPGDLGWGAFVKAGKFGGEPWQFHGWYLYDSPRLDLNPSGYQPDDNVHEGGLYAAYVRPEGVGSLHDFQVNGFYYADFSADGRRIPRGNRLQGDISWKFPNYFFLLFEVGWENPRFDIREIGDTGIPFERRSDVYLATSFNTDTNQPFSLSGGGDVFKTSSTGPLPAEYGAGANAGVSWRPTPSLFTQLSANYNHNPQGARFVNALGEGRYVLGALYPSTLSFTLRASWIFNPRLTLQAYAQFFTAYGHYGPFFAADAPDGQEVRLSRMVPTGYGGNPDFHESALNANVVLRWEYRPGSTFFLVYSRAQDELPLDPGRSVETLAPHALGQGRTSETLLVKYSYWWDV